MADKEVALVVRLKNEASSAAKLITDSFKDLKTTTDELVKSSSKSGGTFGALAKDLGDLEAKAKGLQSLAKIAGQMDRAGAAVDKLKASVAESVTELTKLMNASRDTNARAGQLEAELKKQSDLRTKNRDTLKAEEKAFRDSTAELGRAQAALDKYNASLAKSRGGVAPATGAVSYGKDIVQPVKSARDSAATLLAGDIARAKQEMEASAASVKVWTKAVADSESAVRAAAGPLKVLQGEQRNLAGQIDKIETALEAETAALHQTEKALREMSVVANQAGAALGLDEVNLKKVSAASDIAATNINKVQDALARQTGAKQSTASFIGPVIDPTVARQQSAAAGGGKAAQDLAAYRAQAAALQVTKNAMEGAARAATDLGRQMATTAAPTETLARDFLLAKTRAADLTKAYQDQAVQLNALRGQTQGTFAQFSRAADQMRPLAAVSRQTTQSFSDLPPIAARATGGLANLGNEAERASGGIRSSGNSSREALDLMQRLRGQVLSLTASYIGLQAVIGQLGGVVSAFQKVEAAQNRLGAVFNQDTGKVSQELAFLQAQASRLGISFETLSEQYSKFAVAATASNFTMQDTRKIFTSTAEAARVNKLSVDQTNGAFLALEQMISKGKVSSEELRRQLGDRLPGAFNLFAESLGLSAAELDAMMKKGEVLADSETLLKFADKLNEKYGSQLPDALKTTTTELGKFQNNIFNAQLLVGRGGFIDAFTDALRKMNEYFKSREGRDFFLALGQAAGQVTRALTDLLPYLNQFKLVLAAIIGLRFAGMVASIGTAFGSVAAGVVNFLTLTRSATGVVGSLALGIRGLAAAFGGLPGIIAAIGGIIVAKWLTSVDSVTSALDAHEVIMQKVRGSYAEVGNDAAKWAEKLKEVGVAAAAINKTQTDAALATKLATGQSATGRGLLEFEAAAKSDPSASQALDERRNLIELAKLEQAFLRTGENADEFRKKIDELSKANLGDEELQQYAVEVRKTIDDTANLVKAKEEAAVTFDAVTGKITAQEAALKLFGKTQTEVVDSTNKVAEAQEKYQTAVDKLQEKLPELSGKMKLLKEDAKIDAIFDAAEKALGEYAKQAGLSLNVFEQMRAQLRGMKDDAKAAADFMANQKFGNDVTSALGSAGDGYLRRLAIIESGNRPNAKAETSSASGPYQFLNSTWLKLFDQVIPELKDLNTTQKLALKTGEENRAIQDRIATAFTARNAAALTNAGLEANNGNLYLAHFLGSGGAIKVLLANPDELAAKLAPAAAKANPGVFKPGMTAADLIQWSANKMGGTAKLNDQGQTPQEKFNDDLKGRLADQKAITSAQEESTRAAFIEKAVIDEQNKAKKAGATISEENLKTIRDQAGAEWDAKHANDERNNAQKKQINDLIGLDKQRADAQRQYQEAVRSGDEAGAENAKQQIADLTARINEALPAAQELAKSLGDEKMVATLQKIATNGTLVAGAIRRASSEARLFGLNTRQLEGIGRDFASGLSNVFGDFLQGMRDGKKATDALKDAFLNFAAQFLQKIGQMIVEQTILNLLQKFVGGPLGLKFGSAHTGGLVGAGSVGSGNASRMVDPSIFAGAMRFHSGGLPGLAANEVPAILKKGEEVLTEDDPRNVLNGGRGAAAAGGGGGDRMNVKIINTIDPGDMVSQGLDTVPGEQVLLNVVRKNKSKFQKILS